MTADEEKALNDRILAHVLDELGISQADLERATDEREHHVTAAQFAAMSAEEQLDAITNAPAYSPLALALRMMRRRFSGDE